MKLLLSAIVVFLGSVIVNGQTQDSISAILIKFDVRHDVKESLEALLDESELQEFYYIIANDIVLLKEVHRYGGDNFYRCYDTRKKHQYSCSLGSGKVFASSVSHYIEHGVIVPHRYKDSIQVIEGYDCKPVNVMLDGVIHEVWFTDVFGTHFSTIADIPGIPLYYEKTNPVDGKLKFRAVDVKPIRVPRYYFEIDKFSLFDDPIASGREVFISAEKVMSFSRKSLEGDRISTQESEGKVRFYTFWQPMFNNLNGGIEALNALQKEFRGEDIKFVAWNTLSAKSNLKQQCISDFKFTHAPNADFLFDHYRINDVPTHIVVDKRGYLRFRYKGPLGEPLLNAMRLDLQSLLPNSNPTDGLPVK